MKMRWLGKAATSRIRARLGRNLHRADAAILDQARELIGIQGPPRSTFGEPPRMDTGELFDSLFDEVDAANLQSRIGSIAEHAAYTEIGTPTMAPRPWLVPSIFLAMDDAAKELGR